MRVQERTRVAPFTGAWIEIAILCFKREHIAVAPFTGAWIEIASDGTQMRDEIVAPFTGAWIEIRSSMRLAEAASRSLPSRERGLKSVHRVYAAAQVEGRSLHGSVD